MKYCSACAAPLEQRIPTGDDRRRKVCVACETVHYQNPILVVGCIIERDDEVMLCRRAIEPARGRWTVPAGFLELGEGIQAGARRETREEACAEVEILAPHSTIDLPHIGQVYSLHRARMLAPGFAAGEESLEVRFVPLDAIPWDELAFPVIHFALELLLDDRRRALDHVHQGVLRWCGEGSRLSAASYTLEEHLRLPLQAPLP